MNMSATDTSSAAGHDQAAVSPIFSKVDLPKCSPIRPSEPQPIQATRSFALLIMTGFNLYAPLA